MRSISDIVVSASALLQNKGVVFCVAGIVAVALILLVVLILKKIRNPAGANIGLKRQKTSEPLPIKNYDSITDRIRRQEKKHKCILFAGAQSHCLPVTIPVNVAIELAGANKKCLAIDLDFKRNALAKAFELDGRPSRNGLYPKALQTSVENLWIWPAHNFTRFRQMGIAPLIQRAADSFDFILINAPSLLTSPDRRNIASTAQAAFIFTQNAADTARLTKLIKLAGCDLFGNIQPLQTRCE